MSTLDKRMLQDWREALEALIDQNGSETALQLLRTLEQDLHTETGVKAFSATTPYVNTIPRDQEPPYPGNRDLERINKSLIRWNAMAMVVQANQASDGIGGHISTYASAATLYEVGFNHFFGAKSDTYSGDQLFIQGHASPGIYARAFLEGRISSELMANYRRELKPGGGLSSYPHPWLMPDFWSYPTVSMGLGPIMAIYQARFNRYLENRGLKPANGGHVWAFLGDGETDEPESLGAITLAARERLDNLIFVINCNLQRLDGPVRGNGQIIQELEGLFRGAGWNVIKVLWGSEWDPLFESDTEGILPEVLGSIVDGEYQKFSVESGAYIRRKMLEKDARLAPFLDRLSDTQIRKIQRGGHDPVKVYAAYHRAIHHKGQPTVILAKTIKGYGLGESGEGKNITHQQKKLNEEELWEFRGRFGIPISDEEIAYAPFYRPSEDSPSMKYLKEKRDALGGWLPRRIVNVAPVRKLEDSMFEEFQSGSERPVSTTMVFVRILMKLLRDPDIGKLIVPIVPDEARTFGMDGLFRQFGIYSSIGQLYEPVDAENLLYYKEAKDGQILEEGITEAGAMSSFLAAGTAYASHGINAIPFFVYYSMFGLQRVGDLVWAGGDMRARGFMVGGTSGRTTLAGEGLQHQDGNSHLLAMPVPNLHAYDPAFAYELAVIIQDGIHRMYTLQEDCFYYVTIGNESYAMPPVPQREGIREGILKGMYKFRPAEEVMDTGEAKHKAVLLGSGAIMNEVLKAQEYLSTHYKVAADVWSVTSYKELRNDGMAADRHNMLHPEGPKKKAYVTQCLENEAPVVVAASDYVKMLPDSIARWIPQGITSLGTDGFGRSETRQSLRDFFEVDFRFVTLATLSALMERGELPQETVVNFMKTVGISSNKPNPLFS
ncbi:MAG TPA: pyruvate dehydrogenase (acetyl-transferring), homodimeric type [Candidatus Hydrogenedentes bacterium]|jgi:pyruvate dehydrogenase E1 component|nr:MAG: Pyruvate dehydrogenase E1 component [Candidatus Hydrogenedentes bacterium ADurb.Bin170]HQB03225.1 pyruvate dehydrogenase (acetyl-transferring), homodimeric type [Candidatus Hydrogenedentota bacterium]